MRYYLYCTDNNHDLDVGLMYLNVVQFDCAHLNYIWCVQSRIELGSLNINDDTADSNTRHRLGFDKVSRGLMPPICLGCANSSRLVTSAYLRRLDGIKLI